MHNIIISACDKKWGIGKDGKIPWHFKEDFKWFKKATDQTMCVMGRRTFEDMLTYVKGDVSKLLKNRDFCVISSQNIKGINTFRSVNDAVDCLGDYVDYSFIGGGMIYRDAFLTGIVDTVFITAIPNNYDCDVFFPHELLPPSPDVITDLEEGSDLKLYEYHLIRELV